MAVSSGVCYSSKARDSRLKIEWEKTGTWSSTTCGTNIRWRLILENGNYWYNNAIRCYAIYINGNKVSDGGTWSNYTSSGNHTLIDWQNVSIEHNTNGSEKTFNINFSGWFYSSYDVSGSADFTLPKIPRYTSITSFVVNQVDETNLNIKWDTADAVDYIWYSTNNGSSWTGIPLDLGPTGGLIAISSLSAGTTYQCKIKVRRKDSQLITESNTVPQKTYSYPSITTVGTSILTIGNAQTLTLDNPLNRKNIAIYMKNPDKTKTFYSGTMAEGTSITFTPNASTMYKSIPNDPIGDCVYYCTYSGHTSATKSGKFQITGNEKPIFSNFTYADINNVTTALTGNNQILIKGYSNVRATVSVANKATPYNDDDGSTMKTYTFANGSKSKTENYSSNADVTMDITGIENDALTVTATDSRSLPKAVTKNATFKNYADVTISSVTAVRGSNGVGKEVTLTFSGTFWNNSFGSVTNDFDTLKYYYKLTTANIWTEGTTTLTATKSGDNYSGSFSIRGDLGAEGFDVANSYNIRLVVADKLSTRTYETTLGAGTPAIAIYKNKVAIGGKYDTTGTEALQVNGDISAKFYKPSFYLLDLSSLSTSNFYPITFPKSEPDLPLDCEIHSPNAPGASSYNQNTIHFRIITNGWADTPLLFNIYEYGVYDTNEITIGSIGRSTTSIGSKFEGECVWLRGGLKYRFISNFKPVLHTSNYSPYSGVTYSVGTNYYGGTNASVTILFTPNSTLTGNGGYFYGKAKTADTVSKLGTTDIGSTDRPIYLDDGTPKQCNTPASGNYFRGIPYVSSGGVMEVGRYIDFHPTNGSTLDYSKRIDCGTGTTGRVLTLPDETCTLLGANASGTNYIKMSDGTLICYGSVAFPAMGKDGDSTQNITLPASFKDTNYRVILQIIAGGAFWTWVRSTVSSKSTNKFSVYFYNDGSGTCNAGSYDYIAIGRWK